MSRATFAVIVAICAPVAGLAVWGFQLRQQAAINSEQEVRIDELEKQAWEREYEIKRLREDVDRILMERKAIR